MRVSPDSINYWQELQFPLQRASIRGEEYDTFVSAGSGTEYDSEQILDRLESEIAMMRDGEYPADPHRQTRPVPRIEDDDGDRWIRELVDQEWYDLTTEEDRYAPNGSDTYTHYHPEEDSQSPHQGWKIRVAAYPDEARDVAQTVLPYLQANDISHKVVQDVQSLSQMEGSGQAGKFITIYPDIDDDRQDVIMDEGVQQFKRNDPSWNTFSINSNTKNAGQIVADLEDELRDSVAGLYGRSIDGHHGEEKQYGDTRIHFRYAHHFNTPAAIADWNGETDWVDDHEGLVNEDGELVEGSYIGDQIDTATRPDDLL